MAGNVTGLNVFQDAISPEPLVKLDQNFNALQTALNTLNTFSNFLVDTGTPNNLNVTAGSSQYASYADGLQVLVRIGNTNTGPSTLNINNMGPKPILFPNGVALTENALPAGSIQSFVYNASLNAFQLIGVAGGALTVSAPFSVTDAAGVSVFTVNPDGSGHLGATDNWFEWTPQGNFSFTGTGGQPTLTVYGGTEQPALNVIGAVQTTPNHYAAQFAAPCSPGCSNGIWIAAGTNADDAALVVENCASDFDPPNRQNFCIMRGDGSGALGPAPNQFVWDTAGNFTLSGTATLPPAATINSIGDVTITNPQDGQALIYDAATQKWVNAAPITTLATLTDVALSTPTNGQSLTYNATTQQWVNSTPVTALEQLSNTHISGPAPGQVLTYSVNPLPGWVNATIPGYNFLNTLSIGTLAVGDVLTWDGAGWSGAPPGQVATFPLTSLTDVAISGPLNRQVLTWDAPNNHWINASAPMPSLSTLPDVSLTGQTQGQVLSWDGTLNRWVNSALPGGSVIALHTLMDTNISDPQDNQVLTWDYASARWVNRAVATTLAHLSDVAINNPLWGQVLTYNGGTQRWENGSTVAPITINSPSGANGLQIQTGSNNLMAFALNDGGNAFISVTPSGTGPLTGMLIGSSGDIPISIFNNNSVRLAVNPGGNVIVNASTGGDSLTVYGSNAGKNLTITGGSNPQLAVTNGTVITKLQTIGGTSIGYVGTETAHEFDVITGNIPRITVSAAGNVLVNPPTSGMALTVNPTLNLAAAAGVSPILQWSQSGRTSWQLLNDGGTDSLRFWNSNSSTVMSMSNNGNVVINTPTGGGYPLTVRGQSGPLFQAGAVVTDTAFLMQNAAGNQQFFRMNGDGSGNLGFADSSGAFNWNGQGKYGFGIASPTAFASTSRIFIQGTDGLVPLFVSGLGADWIARIQNSNTSGTSYGLMVQGGLTANDMCAGFYRGGGAMLLQIRGDGFIGMPALTVTTGNNPLVCDGSQYRWLYYTSSLARYKRDVHSAARSRMRDIVSKLRAVTFYSKCEADDPSQIRYGFITEEVAAVDSALVYVDEEGKPVNVAYDRIACLLLPLLQELLGMDEPEGEVYG